MIATSILDRRAVDPLLARATLDQLGQRCREGARWALRLLAAGVIVLLLGLRGVALPLAAGSLGGVFIAIRARGERQVLIDSLVGQRSAYVLPEVAKAGERLVTFEARTALSRMLTSLVRDPTTRYVFGAGFLLGDRVAACADELQTVALLLARERVTAHPSTLALLHQLLHWPLNSPLFNPDLPAAELEILLRRVRLALDGA